MIDQSVVGTDVLLGAAQEIFETMVFMSVDPCVASPVPIKGETLLGIITFTGDIDGCFGLCCTETCARAMAVDMLGLEPDRNLPADEVTDAMGEIVNMLMGSIKAREEGLSRVKVSIPTVVRGREIEHELRPHAKRMISHIRIADQYTAELSIFWRRRSGGAMNNPD